MVWQTHNSQKVKFFHFVSYINYRLVATSLSVSAHGCRSLCCPQGAVQDCSHQQNPAGVSVLILQPDQSIKKSWLNRHRVHSKHHSERAWTIFENAQTLLCGVIDGSVRRDFVLAFADGAQSLRDRNPPRMDGSRSR